MSKRLLANWIRTAKRWFSPSVGPIEVFIGPTQLTYDPANNRLVIHGDYVLHSTGTMVLSSDKEVIVQSGNNGNTYTHGIHLNPDLEEKDVIHVDLCEPGSTGQSNLQPRDAIECLDVATDHGDHDACGKASTDQHTAD